MQALWSNLQSILAAYEVHAAAVARSTIRFQHYRPLVESSKRLTESIKQAAAQRHFQAALRMIEELGQHAEASLLYLQQYHWRPLYGAVVLSYVAWMALLTTLLLGSRSSTAEQAPYQQMAMLLSGAVTAVGGAVVGMMATVTLPVCSHPASCSVLPNLLCCCLLHGLQNRACLSEGTLH